MIPFLSNSKRCSPLSMGYCSVLVHFYWQASVDWVLEGRIWWHGVIWSLLDHEQEPKRYTNNDAHYHHSFNTININIFPFGPYCYPWLLITFLATHHGTQEEECQSRSSHFPGIPRFDISLLKGVTVLFKNKIQRTRLLNLALQRRGTPSPSSSSLSALDISKGKQKVKHASLWWWHLHLHQTRKFIFFQQ